MKASVYSSKLAVAPTLILTKTASRSAAFTAARYAFALVLMAAHSTVAHCQRLSLQEQSRPLARRAQATPVVANWFEDGKKKIAQMQVRSLHSPFVTNLFVHYWRRQQLYNKTEQFNLQAGNYDSAAINKQIDDLLASNKVVVFSFVRCPFCVKAKGLLNELNIPFKAIEVDQIPEGMALRAELANRTGRTSVPSIWIDGQFIGGMNDGNPGLGPLHAQGKLLPLVQ